MPFRPIFLTGPHLWLELFYSLIIILSSLFIYLKTKELYDLTQHQGIKYFRNSFLLFGLAFFSRFIIRIMNFLSDDPLGRGFHQFGLFIFIYAGIAAGLLLIYSIVWKNIKNSKEKEPYIHIISLIISAFIVFTSKKPNFLFLIAALFIIAGILAYQYNKKSENKIKLLIVYLLLPTAWILNAAAQIFIRVSITTALVLYTLSSILFLLITYRVSKVIKN